MSPSGYIQLRDLASLDPTKTHCAALVDNRPYLPNLSASPSDPDSILLAAVSVVLLGAAQKPDGEKYLNIKNIMYRLIKCDKVDWASVQNEAKNTLSCTKVTGGITNALFRISGFQSLLSSNTIQQTLSSIHTSNKKHLNTELDPSLIPFDSVLIRIFGAEGMINRDIETSTYAALCRSGIASGYLGRFSNGRVENWLEGYVPLVSNDLGCQATSMQIAQEMARLHTVFTVPEGELREHHGNDEVGLWVQLKDWMEKAKNCKFKNEHDAERVNQLKLDKIEQEVNEIIDNYNKEVASQDVVFCHNDILAANIMRDPSTGKIQLIDFEYGGSNYKAFDIANHFNEHAGGSTAEEGATPNYDKFPSKERQEMFCTEYVKMVKELEKGEGGIEKDGDLHQEAMDLLGQVKEFVFINHLYWGLWAMNQAADEGCEEFDYITYGGHRFNEFYKRKAEWEKEKM